MAHDVPDQIYLAGIFITVLGTIAVAWISTRGGKKAAEADPFTPQEHGEHAHTRDLIKLESQRILDRIELSDLGRGLARQSQQIGVSAERLIERGKDGKS